MFVRRLCAAQAKKIPKKKRDVKGQISDGMRVADRGAGSTHSGLRPADTERAICVPLGDQEAFLITLLVAHAAEYDECLTVLDWGSSSGETAETHEQSEEQRLRQQQQMQARGRPPGQVQRGSPPGLVLPWWIANVASQVPTEEVEEVGPDHPWRSTKETASWWSGKTWGSRRTAKKLQEDLFKQNKRLNGIEDNEGDLPTPHQVQLQIPLPGPLTTIRQTHRNAHSHTSKPTNAHTSDPLSHHPQRWYSITLEEENEEEKGHAQVAAQLGQLPEGLRALGREMQKLTVQKTRLAVVPGWLGEPTRVEDPSPAKTVQIRAGDSNTKQDIPAPNSKQEAPSRPQPAVQGQPLKKVSTGSWMARAGGLGPRLAARSAY